MSAGHAHGGGPTGHVGGRYRRRLLIAFIMVSTFFAVELITGIVANSLALISDAGHMAADVVSLGAALVATKIATRQDKTGRRSYGSYRAEVFASGFTVLIMLGVAAYVLIEAFGRLGSTVEVETGPVLVVGLFGLIINVITIFMLRSGSKESLNVKGAYFEVMADAAGSVGVMIAGFLVLTTGQSYWDTVIAAAIGIFVAVRAIVLGKQVLAVLGQQVPEGMQAEEIGGRLETIEGVTSLHDLHIWTLTSGMNVATAHLVVADESKSAAVLQAAQTLLKNEKIEHATLQVEAAPTSRCEEIDW